MAHALSLGSDAASPTPLRIERAGYTYRIDLVDGKRMYSVTDGKETITAPIQWTFGAKSQTYVFEYHGGFYEGLVSYFRETGGLDVTIGDSVIRPATLLQALGRPIDNKEKEACFGCHSNAGHTANGALLVDDITPGVTCVRCHSDALQHQAEALRGRPVSLPISLAQQAPEKISEVCGQCHRTWETVMRMHIQGTNDVRFQPYRLANSKCYDGGDLRLSCITCHNPHRSEMPSAAEVDAKCLACHSSSKPDSFATVSATISGDTPRSCPVAQENCASCHMPKVQLPGSHRAFTDHQIRIARATDSYPN
jgi:hypothetical protein